MLEKTWQNTAFLHDKGLGESSDARNITEHNIYVPHRSSNGA